MSRPWMPLYVSDYLGDTGHLSTLQHGAYMLLLMHYWQTGGLPCDENQIRRVARMDADEWRDAVPVLRSLFRENWTHKRMDEELAKASAISSKRADAARQMHDKRNANAPANASNLQTQPQPQACSNEQAAVRDPWMIFKMDVVAAYSPGLPPDTGHVEVWKARGFSADLCRAVVLAGLQRTKPRTLKYFDKAIQEAAVKRAPAVSQSSVNPADAPVFVEKDSEAFERANAILAAKGEPPRKAIPSKYQGLGAWFPPAIAEQAKVAAP